MTVAPREQQQADVVRQLIEAAGGLEAAAEITGMGTSQLARYQSPHEQASMPLRIIAALEAVTHGQVGHPHVTRFLARRNGYALIRRPAAVAQGQDLMRLLADHARTKSECEGEILEALADLKLSQGEAIDLLPKFRRSLEITAQMLAELEEIAGEAGQ